MEPVASIRSSLSTVKPTVYLPIVRVEVNTIKSLIALRLAVYKNGRAETYL